MADTEDTTISVEKETSRIAELAKYSALLAKDKPTDANKALAEAAATLKSAQQTQRTSSATYQKSTTVRPKILARLAELEAAYKSATGQPLGKGAPKYPSGAMGMLLGAAFLAGAFALMQQKPKSRLLRTARR